MYAGPDRAGADDEDSHGHVEVSLTAFANARGCSRTCFSGLRLSSALDVGLGSIIACRHFVVPTTIFVFVRDARRVF